MKTYTTEIKISNLLAIALMLFQVSLFAQEKVLAVPPPDDTDLHSHATEDSVYRESLSGCSASDFVVSDFFLANESGFPLANSCTPEDSQTGFIFAAFGGPNGASRYTLYIDYDIYINGSFDSHVNDCLFNGVAIPTGVNQLVQQIDWNCGDQIELRNFYMSWQTNPNKPCSTNPSKCYFSAAGFIVNGTLIANFESTTRCDSYVVDLKDTTTGGDISGPYASYKWDINNDGSIEYESQDVTHNFGAPGTYPVKLTVTDNDGVTDSQIYNVEVLPLLSGLSLSYSDIPCYETTTTITASGVTGGNGSYTYTISPEPSGFSQSNNVFSNIPVGTYTITVADGNNCSISQNATINSTGISDPIITAPSNVDIEGCEIKYLIDLEATELPYSETPQTITVVQFENEGGTVSGNNIESITYEDSSTGTCNIIVTRLFTVTNECGGSASVNQNLSINDTTAPVFENILPVDITVECDKIEDPKDFKAKDNCSDATVIFNEVRTNGSCDSEYTLERTWTATDECGNSTSHTQTITVQDTTAPVISGVGSGTLIECPESPIFSEPTVSDNCDSNPSLTYVDKDDRDECGLGEIQRTWTATDCAGNVSTATQTIRIEDTTAPTFNEALPADAAVECDNVPSAGTLTASDNCDASVTVNYNEVRTDGSCDSEYTLERTWTATDCAGNSTSHTQTITVQDTTAPTFNEALPADAAVECDNVPSAGTLTASDNCDASVTVNYNEVRTDGSCDSEYTLERTWTATDCAGNSTSHTQTITVQDTTAPTFNEALPADAAVECDNVPSAGTLTASDNCDASVTVNYNEVRTDGSCDSEYTLERTWTATDCAGNSTSHTQTITVQDTTAPTIDVEADDIVVECDGSGNSGAIQVWLDTNGGASASDNCGTVTWTNNYGGATSDCADPIEVIFTATDECGNSTTTSATYTISDTTAPTIDVEASDLTVECDGDGNTTDLEDWLNSNGGASASDDCSAVAWSNDFTGLSDDCGATGSATVTFTVTDGCGNTSSTTATFTIEDTINPTFNESLPTDITVECDNVPTAVTLTATDNCDVNPTVIYSEVRTDGNCDGNYKLIRVWTAIDQCDNTTVHTQTITVEDTTAPTFNEALPADETVQCGVVADAVTLTASDNCGTAEVTFTETSADGSCPGAYVLTRTWTATDQCGNTTVHTQTATVEDTTAPTFNEALPADETVQCGVVADAVTLTASDNCGTAEVTFTETSADGSCPGAYVLTRTWTATDQCGNTTVHTQTVTVEDTTAPTFNEALPADETVQCGVVADAVTLTASDNCGTAEVTFTETSADGSCPGAYVLTRTWTATDQCGNTTVHTQTVTVEDTTAPTFNEALPADETVQCGVVADAVTLTASDNCGTAEVTFTETSADGSCPGAYVLTRTWTATDQCGNTTVHTQTVTVEDTTAPTFNEALPADETVQCGVVADAVTLTASDNCGTAEVTFTETSADGSCPGAYVLTRTWTATDQCGNTTMHTQTVTVEDTTAPTFNEALPADETVQCGVVADAVTLTASDNCGTAEVTFTETSADGSCPGAYVLTRTWTATDQCGNTTVHTQTVTVEDTTAPTFNEALPADETVQCGVVADAVTLTASDNCGTAEVTFTETSADGSCPGAYVLTRTWTATDQCGNTTVHTQTVTVEDTTAPTFNEALPADETVQCGVVADAVTLTASDNCGTAEVTFTETSADGSCPGAYVLTRTWTATDQCGNTTVHTQTVTVEDTTAPTFNEALPADETVQCGVVADAVTLTASDNCGTAEVTFTETSADGSCPGAYVLTRTWTATDQCGNTTVHTQTVTVEDTTAPTFNEALPADETVQCGVVADAVTLTASDNCGTAEVTFTETSADGSCPGAYVLTRTWTATDQCGNTTMHTQTVTVEDTTAPITTTEFDAEISVTCGDIPDSPDLEFEDACSSNITVEFEETSTFDGSNDPYEIIRTWTVTDECGNVVTYTQTISVTVESNVEGLSADLCNGDDIQFDLFTLLNGTYDTGGTWTVASGNTTIDGNIFNPYELELGTYTFIYADDLSACPSETTVTITLNDDCVVLPCGDADEVIISKAVTANGDQWNEYFTVTGIEGCGFTVEVQIFNRWGAMIYESKDYQNNWNAFVHGNSVGGSDKVPTGTYYYIINLKESGLKPFAGPIYVGTK